MRNLSNVGRVFYGLSIAVLGFVTVYDHDFPYMMIPANHAGIPGLAIVAYISGALLVLAGICIVFEKMTMQVSLLLGSALLLIFCFYFIPYQFTVSPNYMQFGDWENSEKELALAGGAFVVAGCFSKTNENAVIRFLRKLIPIGAILFALTMICFGIDHFLFAHEVLDYVPAWVPYHLFWIYAGGIGLLGSGLAIILNIKRGLFAFLLGSMIFIWFAILHTPRVIASPVADLGSELTSAFLALAYCGTAFVIAGAAKKKAVQ